MSVQMQVSPHVPARPSGPDRVAAWIEPQFPLVYWLGSPSSFSANDASLPIELKNSVGATFFFLQLY